MGISTASSFMSTLATLSLWRRYYRFHILGLTCFPLCFDLVVVRFLPHPCLARFTFSLSATILLEVVKRRLRILTHFDQVTIRIPHVTSPFVAVIVQRLGQKMRSFPTPFLVAIPDVRDTQI